MKRHAFFAFDRAAPSARAESSGCEIFHSRTSESSTPSALASAHTARSRAALPLVQDAYAIFTVDAAPGPPAGDVESRGARLHRWGPDDAAVHEPGAALLDDAADLARRGRRDRVA